MTDATQNAPTDAQPRPAVAGPVEPTVRPLVERLRQCLTMRHETALMLEAADEIDSLRAQLDEAIKDADRAIEHARRVDAKEREALRAALAGLVQVYVVDGAATTPASEIGDAWKAAQRALLRA